MTPFKIRHSNHKREIKNKISGLGYHYGDSGGCNYENISKTSIEEIETKTLEFLAKRETFWQHQLRVYVENGSNGHWNMKEIWVWPSSDVLRSIIYFDLTFISSWYGRSCLLCCCPAVSCTWQWTLNLLETIRFAI